MFKTHRVIKLKDLINNLLSLDDVALNTKWVLKEVYEQINQNYFDDLEIIKITNYLLLEIYNNNIKLMEQLKRS